MAFTRDQKIILTHCTRIAERVAVQLDNNGFVDGPNNLRALLPINTEERVERIMDLLPKLRAKLLERIESASGMSGGEIVCLSFVSELFGVLEGPFSLLAIEPSETDSLFPVEVSDGIRKIDLD